MFRKKNQNLGIAIFSLSVNLTRVERWKTNKSEILPVNNWLPEEEIKTYRITMLPEDPWVFYHNGQNEFSHTVAGFEEFQREVGFLEWSWERIGFLVLSDDEPIFTCEMSFIESLLINGVPPLISGNLKSDMEGVKVPLGSPIGNCKEVLFRSKPKALSFQNELVHFSVRQLDTSYQVEYGNS